MIERGLFHPHDMKKHKHAVQWNSAMISLGSPSIDHYLHKNDHYLQMYESSELPKSGIAARSKTFILEEKSEFQQAFSCQGSALSTYGMKKPRSKPIVNEGQCPWAKNEKREYTCHRSR